MMSTDVIIRAPTKENSHLLSAAHIVLSSLFIALCAQISIPLAFTPVPLTLQTLSVMMVGGMLGSRKGAISVALYLLESIVGLPVLAGGVSNSFALIGPKGGYLIGFVFQAYLVGWFAERMHQLGKSALMLGMVSAYALQLTVGSLWLGQFVGFQNALVMGVLPFIPGAIVKILVAINVLTRNERTAS